MLEPRAQPVQPEDGGAPLEHYDCSDEQVHCGEPQRLNTLGREENATSEQIQQPQHEEEHRDRGLKAYPRPALVDPVRPPNNIDRRRHAPCA